MSDGFLAYLRGRILDTLRSRLRMIQVEAGYVTNAGKAVTFGRTALDDGSVFPRVALVVTEDTETKAQGRQVHRTLRVTAEGMDRASYPDPLEAAEALLGDIKRALFLPEDKTLSGLLDRTDGLQVGEERHLPHEPGGKYVSVQVDAVVTWAETYGDPR